MGEPGEEAVTWTLVYDLAADKEHVRHVQDASLHRPGFGFPPEPFLFGSPEWWREVETERIPRHWAEGVITDVYWASMADYPEFRMRSAAGAETTWTRKGDVRRYVEGLRVKVSFVELEWNKDGEGLPALGPSTEVELQMWVEESPLRSPAVAPGPGGVGYELEGGPGTVLHYLRPTDRDRADELAKALRPVADVHVYADGAGAHWLVRVKDAASASTIEERQVELGRLVEQHGGQHDGSELIGHMTSEVRAAPNAR